MPTVFLVDDTTNTPFTSGSAGVQVVVGTATSINGSPIGALAGLVGNLAIDTSTNTLWACTASGTSGSAQWEQVLTDPSLYALINGSSGQVFNVADATQDSEAVNLGQLTDGSLSPSFASGSFSEAVIASGGTSGDELINYTQMTNGSLSPNFGSGSFSGQLSVPDATASGSAINYGQAFQLLSGTPPSTITLGNTLKTVAQYGLTAATTIALEPGSVVGQEITVFGGAYALTIQSNVSSGNPSFALPDGSYVFSWTIAAIYDNGIHLVWDGLNWQSWTFGQQVVAAATQNNAAVQLAQVLNTAPGNNVVTVNSPAASTTYSSSVTVTAPCNGYLLAQGYINSPYQLNGLSVNLYVNGVSAAQDSIAGLAHYNLEQSFVGASAGTAYTVEFEYTTGSTAPDGLLTLHVNAIFIPAP